MKPIRLVVVRSTTRSDMLSVRVNPDEATATSFYRALTESGAEVGDAVELRDEWRRPMLKAGIGQLRALSEHCATCAECRANVISAWSVSADVTDTLEGLCLDGKILVASKIFTVPKAAGS